MSKRFLRRILSSIVLLVTITAFTISPFAHTLLTDERLDQKLLNVQQGDYPEWEEIIKTTFQALGITQFGFNKYNPTGYLGAIGTDAAQVNAVSLTIMETEYVTLCSAVEKPDIAIREYHKAMEDKHEHKKTSCFHSRLQVRHCHGGLSRGKEHFPDL